MTGTDEAARQSALLQRARRRSGTARPRPAARPATAPQDVPPAPVGPAPLSHAQQRMWLMDRLGQGGALYNVPVATRLRGPLDIAALATALTALTARHAVLRTRYGQRDEQPYQEVLPPAPVPVPVRDAAPEQAAALLHAEAVRPFDLAAGPVLRALVLRHGPDDHTLLLTVHHIAVDGGSLPVVAADLAALYATARTGRPADLPEPGLPYAEYARRERARDAELARAADDLAARLVGARTLPLLRPVPTGAREPRAGLHTAPLGTGVLDGLRRIGTEHGATLFTVVLAAALAALHRASGETDLTVGFASGHRARPELRRTVGLAVNTLPVRAGLDGDPAFTEVLARTREALLHAQDHHEVPFDLVLQRLGAEARGEHGSPLLAVTCDLVGPPAALALPGLDAEAVDLDLGLAKFGLALAVEDGPQPRCLVQHDLAALDAPAGARLAAGFAALLTAVAAEPGRRLGTLPGERLNDAPAPADSAPAAPSDAATAAATADASPPAPPADRPAAADHPAVAALLADPRVGEAVVLARAGRAPLAYATVHGPVAPSGADLRAALRRRLPAAHLPLAVTLLDALPRRADGTVDPARLPGAPATADPAGPAGPAAADPGPLDAVRTAFAELLGTRPQPDGDFFVLGGHSLVAVQLAERLRSRTGLPLTGLDILERRTPRALAALLAERSAERRAASARRTGPRPGGVREGTVLLTGGTGGVGAAVLQELMAQGRPVRALARPESAHLVALDGVEVAEGDLGDPDSLRRAVEGVDAVIHSACTFTEHATDTAAMRALVDGWRGSAFVFVSSIDAYGRPAGAEVPEGAPAELPLSAYGQAKLDCERILFQAAGRDGRGTAASVRSPIVWGPHRRLRDQLRWGSTGALFQAVQAGREVTLPPVGADDPWYGISWVHSAALARALTACTDPAGPAAGRVVNAVTGHLSWTEFTTGLIGLLGSDAAVRHRGDADPELLRPWHYRAEALAGPLRPEPGEDWRTVLAGMLTR
ncbi:condensation domain-containing protein [Kitasatospora sp. NPDC054939]